MKYLLLISLIIIGCTTASKPKTESPKKITQENLIAIIDTIWKTEQEPIRLRDSLIAIYGVDHSLVKKQNLIIDENHAINEKK